MPGRVGNADLYIGMVRKRKSLPRDSKGFEPIEQYLKEFEEELNRTDSDLESGEETDVEEEMKREKEAWELKRRAKEKRAREEKERKEKEEERERKAKQEREKKEKEEKEKKEKEKRAKEEEEKKRERELERRRKAEEEERQTKSRRVTESGKTEGGGGKQKSRVQGRRRSQRLKGTSDTESSATDGEETRVGAGGVAGGVAKSVQRLKVAKIEVESDLTSVESGSEREGGEDRGRRRSTRRGRPRKSAVLSLKKTTAIPVSNGDGGHREEVAEEEEERGSQVTSEVGARDEVEESGGSGRVDSVEELYSPTVTPSSPARDTMKVGPIRLTFSISPSDDERRRKRKRIIDSTTAAQATASEKQVTSQQDMMSNTAPPPVPSGSSQSQEADTDRERPVNTSKTINPKKTSTWKQRGMAKSKLPQSKRGHASVVSSQANEEEEEEEWVEEEEEDVELLSLLEPSARVSRLIGLSQLGARQSTRRKSEVKKTRPSQTIESEMEEKHTKTKKLQTQVKRKPSAKATTSSSSSPPPPRSSATTSKKTGKKSRKSVVFNPFTTNLGSPEISTVPKQILSPASDPEGGVYNYVPSDEEDLTHSKSRLYSPRRNISLRKAASSIRKKRERGSRGDGQRREIARVTEPTGSDEVVEEEEEEVDRRSGRVVEEVTIRVENGHEGGQWFVPESLDLHTLISDKSPLSLKRLTRSSQRTIAALPSSTDTPSSSGIRRKPYGTYKKNKSKSKQQTRPSRPTSSKQERRSKKRPTPPPVEDETTTTEEEERAREVVVDGEEVVEEEEEEEEEEEAERDEITKTPAMKKARVTTTQEEDEGMQSGGALSLSSSSSSEDEREAKELVRSIGGRRYRRYVVEYQNPKTPGVRRSKRNRIAPVQHWLNENTEYVMENAGETLKGVLVPVSQPVRKPKKKKRKISSSVAVEDYPPLVVTDKHGVKKSFEVVTHPSLCDRLNGQGELAVKGEDDMVVIKLCSSPITNCGLLEIRPYGEKEKSASTTHEVFFFVLKGRAHFVLGRQVYELGVDSQLRIPAGVTYGIKNTQRSMLRLYYFSCSVSPQ